MTPDVELAPEVVGVASDTDRAADAPVVDPDGIGAGSKAFAVRVGEFEGPFDLLLTLISKHKLEVTELALHTVTDEFIAYIRGQGHEWDLDEASGFLVVAATLLDLKAARLLPYGSVEDEEDLALLEARDLLFARLLQYRAYKEVGALHEGMLTDAATAPPEDALEPAFAELLPEVLIGLGPEQFAAIAEAAFEPRPPEPGVSVAHIHAPAVSVREQAAILVERLRRRGVSTFRALTEDAPNTLVVVGRFLALLELYRDGVVTFEQAAALGELSVRWVGPDDEADAAAIAERAVTDEFRGVVEATEPDPRRNSDRARPGRARHRGGPARCGTRRGIRCPRRGAGWVLLAGRGAPNTHRGPRGPAAARRRADDRHGPRCRGPRAGRRSVEAILRGLSDEYTADQRGFDLREVAGGSRSYTRAVTARGRRALRARRQSTPDTGVAGDARRHRLPAAHHPRPHQRRSRGQRRRRHPHPAHPRAHRGGGRRVGRAATVRTTGHFLERMGIASLDDLPPLAEHLPDLADLEDVLDSTVPQGDDGQTETTSTRRSSPTLGWGSRRACEVLIEEGRVEVDGKRVTEQGMRVDPATAIIRVDGERVPTAAGLAVFAFNKPRGVISTMSDDEGRPCVGDWVAGRNERLFDVGRLDINSEGLHPADQRRRTGEPAGAPVIRRGQDVPGDRPGASCCPRTSVPSRRAWSWRTASPARTRCGSSRRPRTARWWSW